MEQSQLSAAFLWILAGGIVSLAAAYIPKFSSWFEAQAPNGRRGWMAIFLLITSVGLVALSCYEATAVVLARYVVIVCTEGGILEVIEVFVFALIGNQSTFLISPSKK